MNTTIRRILGAFVLLTLAATGGLVAAAPASAQSTPVLTGFRTGLHNGFDRIVLDMSGPNNVTLTPLGFSDELLADPSGEIFWLTGVEFFTVVVHGAAAHDDNGNVTEPRKFRTRNLRNVAAVGITGDFEATLSIGIGTRYQSWTRVFTLSSPTRVVIDIGH